MYQKLISAFVKVIVGFQFHFNRLNGVEKIDDEKKGPIQCCRELLFECTIHFSKMYCNGLKNRASLLFLEFIYFNIFEDIKFDTLQSDIGVIILNKNKRSFRTNFV